MKKTLKFLMWFIGAYVSIALMVTVAIAVTQPLSDGRVKITTLDASGERHETVLRLIEDDKGDQWLWSRRWFRTWYNRALEQGHVEYRVDDQVIVKTANEVTNAETVELVVQSQREKDSALRWWINRALALFAPIKLIQLSDPAGDS